MKRNPASLAFALLIAAGATAGCGLPERIRERVAPRPTPTVAPTPTPVPVPPLKMDFVRIREERVRGSAGRALCEIDIELVGARRSEVQAARVLVRAAVDDLGTSLVLGDAAAAALAPLKGDDPDAPIVLPVPLKLAARKAVSLREVSGEIELYVPSADRGVAPASAATNPVLDASRLPPNTLRRYRFVLKDVPLP